MGIYRISNQAKDDLIRIYNYGALHFGIAQADKYFESFFNQFEIIANNPNAFESVDYIKPGYRRCPCGADSIFYRVNERVIEIMAIVGRQELDSIF
jgi:toxin ParE1/3/4